MKKQRIRMPLWVVIMGLIFAVGVVSISGMQVRAQQEERVESIVMEEEQRVIEEKTDKGEEEELVMIEEEKEVDYYLPYPGILPDHPLYWLKMVRDRVQLLLITDPLTKAKKLLLYADKRLGAGWALVEGNKIDLGVTTLTKAEKYLERAVMTADKLGDGGEEERFKEKLEKAEMKHREVLLKLKENVSGEYKIVIEQFEN